MRRTVLCYLVAVLLPGLILGSLALGSVRDQRLRLEHQESLLCQVIAVRVAESVRLAIHAMREEFNAVAGGLPPDENFDEALIAAWPGAETGFLVGGDGSILSPDGGSERGRGFLSEHAGFLGNQEVDGIFLRGAAAEVMPSQITVLSPGHGAVGIDGVTIPQQQLTRNVMVQAEGKFSPTSPSDETQRPSKVVAGVAGFDQIRQGRDEGILARWTGDGVGLWFWRRAAEDPALVQGAQVNMRALIDRVRPVVEGEYSDEFCIALLNENAEPMLLSQNGFEAPWRTPFVAEEIGEELPRWEAAVYLADPGRIARAAAAAQWTIGLVVIGLVCAICAGGWLIFTDLARQMRLAREKSDFVGNVSHELKTPLASIRLFTELLADPKGVPEEKRTRYLDVITTETARLGRLIHRVLDFQQMERGVKSYNMEELDLVKLADEIAAAARPRIEAEGFRFSVSAPAHSVTIRGDHDALAAALWNLLSNAQKYSGAEKNIILEVGNDPPSLRVLDRGPGVPARLRRRIFEQFERGDDSLSTDVPGSGLGLALVRETAAAHGARVECHPRAGGGSSFEITFPNPK